MEYESKKDLLSTNVTGEVNGSRIQKDKKEKIIELFKDGKTNAQVAEITGVSKPTVIAIKKNEIANGFSINEWKKQVSTTLAQIVVKGSNRLVDDIDKIPAGQLPLALAILTDKILQLQDAPTTVVEHRLRVTHEDINKMIKGEVINLDKEPISSEPKENNDLQIQ
jgi:hypothetical protein